MAMGENQKEMTGADEPRFLGIHTKTEIVERAGEQMLRVVKTEKINEYDTNSYAKISGSDFHNGMIEADVLSRLLPDAPDFARGFIGIAFRISKNDDLFESFYIRPTNGRCEDQARRGHAVQYFSFPKYTFAYFRENGITKYEAPADIGLNEWIHLKAEIHGSCGKLSVNSVPVLNVNDMKLGGQARGAVGFFVDIGTEGFFKNLRITYED